MLHYTRSICHYAEEAESALSSFVGAFCEDTLHSKGLAGKIKRAHEPLERVIDQTDRRIFKNESVPATEKVISFFESYSNIIV